jgi:hypothetical protein
VAQPLDMVPNEVLTIPDTRCPHAVSPSRIGADFVFGACASAVLPFSSGPDLM